MTDRLGEVKGKRHWQLDYRQQAMRHGRNSIITKHELVGDI